MLSLLESRSLGPVSFVASCVASRVTFFANAFAWLSFHNRFVTFNERRTANDHTHDSVEFNGNLLTVALYIETDLIVQLRMINSCEEAWVTKFVRSYRELFDEKYCSFYETDHESYSRGTTN